MSVLDSQLNPLPQYRRGQTEQEERQDQDEHRPKMSIKILSGKWDSKKLEEALRKLFKRG